MATPPCILVVDDNPMNRDILETRLSAHGYKILTAGDGDEALAVARNQRLDLILLDIVMPKMNGIDVCRSLKADSSLSFIPVIMLTVKDDVKDIVAGLDAGADEYLTKPVNPSALLARVKSMLRIKRLYDEVQAQAIRLEKQSVQLKVWNQTLEEKVKEQVAEIERMGRFRRFLSPQIAEVILEDENSDPFKTHRREVTVTFIDLRGFTAFSDSAEPEEVIDFLRTYHAEMGRLIFQYEGTVEHFAGDGIMAFFGDPIPREDHTEAATRMSVEMVSQGKILFQEWLKRGYDLDIGIGLATGYATLGTIGFEGRMDYGAVGNVTILASRLSSESEGGQILTDQRTLAKIEALVEAEPLGELHLKGFARPISSFNIAGLK